MDFHIMNISKHVPRHYGILVYYGFLLLYVLVLSCPHVSAFGSVVNDDKIMVFSLGTDILALKSPISRSCPSMDWILSISRLISS